jgi:signal transduction histidine kinase
MKGYLSLLPEIEDKKDRDSATVELLDSAVRMERILNGLIELIDFKKNTEPVVKQFNLANIYQETIDDLQPYIYKAEADFRADIPKDLTINYIGAYLNSIFFNLIHNAIKYRDYTRKLVVDISIREEDEFIVFTVKDNGMGMDLNKYGHFLFKPFKRLTVEREGTGIGLSIINNSVRRNGGRIEVESRINRGTTFEVYLKSYELNAL